MSSYPQPWPYRQMWARHNQSATYATVKTFTLEDVERSRMLRNVPYNHLDPTLVRDRKRCERALERFSDASKIDSGLNDEEARNLLWKVFDLGRDG